MTNATKVILSMGFDAGNYAGAYVSKDFSVAYVDEKDTRKTSWVYQVAYILGFFSSYEVHEIPLEYQTLHREAYMSEYGQAVLEAGYIDRYEEYER